MSHHMSHYDHMGDLATLRAAQAAKAAKAAVNYPTFLRLFLAKLMDLANRGVINREAFLEAQKAMSTMTLAQVRNLVASAVEKDKEKGYVEIRAAFDQAVAEAYPRSAPAELAVEPLAPAGAGSGAGSQGTAPPAASAFPVVPVAIAAAGLAAILLMRKK